MQIGLFYQIQVPKPWNAESETNRYWEMLEEVSYAEEMGMESVWFVEHHFRSEWSHSSAPDLTLAAISQMGGWGFWKGLGTTSRGGIWKY